jgi:hypothetical protein
VIGRCVRSATQQWPKRVDGRLDRSVESEDQAARVGAESEGAAARLVGPELGDVDQLRQAIHSANRASRGISEVHFRRMRRRRRWGSLTNRDAGFSAVSTVAQTERRSATGAPTTASTGSTRLSRSNR